VSQQKGDGQSQCPEAELVKKRNVDEDTNADHWMPSKRRHKMNAWRGYISHKLDVSNMLDADFNFPKIHLVSHWVEQIP